MKLLHLWQAHLFWPSQGESWSLPGVRHSGMTLVPQVISLPKTIKEFGKPLQKRWQAMAWAHASLCWPAVELSAPRPGGPGGSWSQGQNLLLVSAPVLSPKPQYWLCPSCSCCSHLLSGRRPLAPPLFQSSEARLLVNILRASDSPPWSWSGTAEGTAQTNVLGLPDTGSLRTGNLLPSPSGPSQPWLPWASGAPADLPSHPRGWGRLFFFLFENLIPAKWGEDS